MSVILSYFSTDVKRDNASASNPPGLEGETTNINPVGGGGQSSTPPVAGVYESQAEMIADQDNQKIGFLYFDGTENFWYKGGGNGLISDYEPFNETGAGYELIEERFTYTGSQNFTISYSTPVGVSVYLNGQRIVKGTSFDWTITANVVTVTLPLSDTHPDEIVITYFREIGALPLNYITGSGTGTAGSGRHARFYDSEVIGDSIIGDDGTTATVYGSLLIQTLGNEAGNFLTKGTGNVIKERTPAETLSDIGGVPNSRTITINGTAFDLSANRSWSVGTVTSITAGTGLTGGTITGSGTINVSLLGIQTLTDPNADRILFWDDSAGSSAWLTVSTGLSLSGTTLTNSDRGSSQLIFKTIAVSGQTSVTTNSNSTTLNFAVGSGILITTNNTTKTVTYAFDTAFGDARYALASSLSGYVPTTRTLTINGTAFDLSANRSWNVGTVTSVTAGDGLGGGTITGSGTLTNADKGSSQFIFKTIASTALTSITANSNTATLNVEKGTGITLTTDNTTKTLTIGFDQAYGDGRYALNSSLEGYYKTTYSNNSYVSNFNDVGGNLNNMTSGAIWASTNIANKYNSTNSTVASFVANLPGLYGFQRHAF